MALNLFNYDRVVPIENIVALLDANSKELEGDYPHQLTPVMYARSNGHCQFDIGPMFSNCTSEKCDDPKC